MMQIEPTTWLQHTMAFFKDDSSFRMRESIRILSINMIKCIVTKWKLKCSAAHESDVIVNFLGGCFLLARFDSLFNNFQASYLKTIAFA